MIQKKLKVNDRKEKMGYGFGIRQCHNCYYVSSYVHKKLFIDKENDRESTAYFCSHDAGLFAVKKTASCKFWRK